MGASLNLIAADAYTRAARAEACVVDAEYEVMDKVSIENREALAALAGEEAPMSLREKTDMLLAFAGSLVIGLAIAAVTIGGSETILRAFHF